jgi:hypothetical protein
MQMLSSACQHRLAACCTYYQHIAYKKHRHTTGTLGQSMSIKRPCLDTCHQPCSTVDAQLFLRPQLLHHREHSLSILKTNKGQTEQARNSVRASSLGCVGLTLIEPDFADKLNKILEFKCQEILSGRNTEWFLAVGRTDGRTDRQTGRTSKQTPFAADSRRRLNTQRSPEATRSTSQLVNLPLN